MQEQNNNTYLAIEGNIGAGKSTFLKMIESYLDAHILFEPHQKWQDVDGENILDYFYKDTQRWGYTFQNYVLITRLLSQKKSIELTKKKLHFFERSLYSDRYCFAQNCFETGSISSVEWKLYKDIFAEFQLNYAVRPSAFIYLQTDPEICFERLVKRNRTEEGVVSLDYIRLLHQKHESLFILKEIDDLVLKQIPVLVLSCNDEFENNGSIAKRHIDSIIEFIKTAYSRPVLDADKLTDYKGYCNEKQL
jgi:deoxyadenosine/deoxycytidine kinase